MNFLRNFFGKKQSAHPPRNATSEKQSIGKVGELQKKAEEKINLLRYLISSGQFGQEKMATYISIFEQSGNQIDPQRKSQMLNADEFLMPKAQSDGKLNNGFEQLRQSFMQVHMEELSMVIKLVKELPPEPASFKLLKHIIDETDELQRLSRRVKS